MIGFGATSSLRTDKCPPLIEYDLGQRAATMEATRDKIVDATIALHTEQGIVATTYRDIAQRADVGMAPCITTSPPSRTG